MFAKTHTLVKISTLPKIISQKTKRSSKNKTQDIKLNQLKLEKHDTYETAKKITTNFELDYDKDVTNKAYLNETILK